MKVEEYRDLIANLSYWFASLRGAATDQERVAEADRVRRAAQELMNARTPRANKSDREKAQRWIDLAVKYLIDNKL